MNKERKDVYPTLERNAPFYELNTEQCLGYRIDFDFFVVAKFGLPNNRIESCIPMNVLGLCLNFLAI
jgi:hypothetical protein